MVTLYCQEDPLADVSPPVPRSALKFIEQRLTQKKAKLKYKLPEIEKSYACAVQLDTAAVRRLQEPLCSQSLSCVHARATPFFSRLA